jgi:hypothetical protein
MPHVSSLLMMFILGCAGCKWLHLTVFQTWVIMPVPGSSESGWLVPWCVASLLICSFLTLQYVSIFMHHAYFKPADDSAAWLSS